MLSRKKENGSNIYKYISQFSFNLMKAGSKYKMEKQSTKFRASGEFRKFNDMLIHAVLFAFPLGFDGRRKL